MRGWNGQENVHKLWDNWKECLGNTVEPSSGDVNWSGTDTQRSLSRLLAVASLFLFCQETHLEGLFAPLVPRKCLHPFAQSTKVLKTANPIHPLLDPLLANSPKSDGELSCAQGLLQQ